MVWRKGVCLINCLYGVDVDYALAIEFIEVLAPWCRRHASWLLGELKRGVNIALNSCKPLGYQMCACCFSSRQRACERNLWIAIQVSPQLNKEDLTLFLLYKCNHSLITFVCHLSITNLFRSDNYLRVLIICNFNQLSPAITTFYPLQMTKFNKNVIPVRFRHLP